MTRFRHAFPALALSLLLGAAAVPAMADMPCGPMGGGMREHRAERMEQHHKRLHDALKLNADQEVAWKKLIESEHPMAAARPGAGKTEDWAALTTPERAERMLERMRAHQSAMADHVAQLKAFYGLLSPEQQKIFDDAHRGGRRGMRGKGMGPGQS